MIDAILPLTYTVSASGIRSLEYVPMSLRLICRGLVNGAFCWDANGDLAPDITTRFYGLGLIKDLNSLAIARATIDETYWTAAIDHMGGLIECPWGPTIFSFRNACLATIDFHSRSIASAGFPVGLSASETEAQALSWLTDWQPTNLQESRSRDYYLTVMNPNRETLYPDWLLAGNTPNMHEAHQFLAEYPQDDNHPLRLACTFIQLQTALILLEGID